MAEDVAGKQRGRPFPKGVSGNPAGRPKGLRNRATLAAEALLDGEAEALTRKCVELALNGDSTALRLCLERLLPPARSRPIQLELPEVRTPENVLAALTVALRAMAAGEVTPEEMSTIAAALEQKRKALEVVELEQRLSRLEQQSKR
jgi:Family of unknown function (DUF5681)